MTKKLVVTIVLVTVVTMSAFAVTVAERMAVVVSLIDEWYEVFEQVMATPPLELLGSHAIAVYRLQKIADKMEQELIEAVQCDMSLKDAMFTLFMVHAYVSMQITTDGVREKDWEKIGTGTKVAQWATAKLGESP